MRIMTCNVQGRVGRWLCRPGFTLADIWTAEVDGVWTSDHFAVAAEVES